MIVRAATHEDVELAAAAEPPGANIARSHFARHRAGQAHFLIAREGPEVIGGALVVGDEVRHLHVLAHARGRGVGTALIRAAEEFATSQGLGAITIGVEAGNASAARLYRRLGFLPTGHVQTDTYTYVTAGGERRTATETSEQLRKAFTRAPH